MILSKKETSILIEIIFSILFLFIFLPFFYANQKTSFTIGDLSKKIIEIIIFAVAYFSITYTFLEVYFKNNIVEDERNDMIVDFVQEMREEKLKQKEKDNKKTIEELK